jgi:hypothetical protein
MCLGHARRKLPGVNATTTQITLELELDGDTVSGTTVDSRGTRREFSGWIGLMGVLDALLDEARTASPATPPQGENDDAD